LYPAICQKFGKRHATQFHLFEYQMFDCSRQEKDASQARCLDRYIGYWKPYATSHAELDADTAIQDEVRFAARTLLDAVKARRAGKSAASPEISAPREK